MTSRLCQSSHQDCRNLQVVVGKSVQPSWLHPSTQTILKQSVTLITSSTVNCHKWVWWRFNWTWRCLCFTRRIGFWRLRSVGWWMSDRGSGFFWCDEVLAVIRSCAQASSAFIQFIVLRCEGSQQGCSFLNGFGGAAPCCKPVFDSSSSSIAHRFDIRRRNLSSLWCWRRSVGRSIMPQFITPEVSLRQVQALRCSLALYWLNTTWKGLKGWLLWICLFKPFYSDEGMALLFSRIIGVRVCLWVNLC